MIVFIPETKTDFLEWRGEHEDWFVVSERSTEHRMLHRARCGHFKYEPEEKVSLSKNPKYCSEDLDELQAWFRRQGGGKLLRCKDCL